MLVVFPGRGQMRAELLGGLRATSAVRQRTRALGGRPNDYGRVGAGFARGETWSSREIFSLRVASHTKAPAALSANGRKRAWLEALTACERLGVTPSR